LQHNLFAIINHLDVLGEAGLTARTKRGRTASVDLVAEPMEGAMAW
jgi:hypothetical protein